MEYPIYFFCPSVVIRMLIRKIFSGKMARNFLLFYRSNYGMFSSITADQPIDIKFYTRLIRKVRHENLAMWMIMNVFNRGR